jgi:glutathione S-transferase
MLKIMGKPGSINVRKVLWTCIEIGLPFELDHWGSGFRATDDPAFLALNPNAMVPVIRDDDFVLWESNSICRYLAARHGCTDLLPTDPQQRARVEQWMDWQATELNPAWRYAFMALVRKSPAHTDADALAAGISGWNRQMAILDARLDDTGAYAAGDRFTLADVVLGLSVNRWRKTLPERPRYAAVEDYMQRLSRQPGYALHCENGMP